jgi:tRNA(Arg) A34 adenosine deaminase TadA
MCMAALHWARVDTVYFGASIADAAAAGFNELALPANELLRLGESTVRLVPGVLTDDCRELFNLWSTNPDRVVY